LGADDIIVSKTDIKGLITYANQTFLEIADYTESEVLGRPHNLIRHPDMPRAVFKFLWQTIQAGQEVFAFVVNRSKNGDHYWVFAHVTPTFGDANSIVGYHSSRRAPSRQAVGQISGIYQTIRSEERRHSNPKDAVQAGVDVLTKMIKATGGTYEDFIFGL
jgi:PAS domain S-box-containing protein